MVWGVLVIALATGILFSSFFTETWAQDARYAAESMGPAVGPEPRRLGPGAAWSRELPPSSSVMPAERTIDREPAERTIDREPAVREQAYVMLCAQARRLDAITRWLRVCSALYLLLGIGADWLCSTLIR
ncbi:hypothetical protein KO481_23120 [Nocardia sp. NEAU-G5]|uniref:Uncharacterized protein n=1 Tax=Nocardia albiluteola TaxID=2842303 RepID=A0ABS6B282_9NOCA|nr:hypothetical protein [Nocardia albiluteola]MBU3064412.1 hypothetical protein [Nocardia albiluteola]